MKRSIGIILIVVALAATLTAAASGAGKQKFKTKLTRGSGTTLILKASSKKVFQSFAFNLARKGYEVTSSVLVKENGKPTHLTARSGPCYPSGRGVVCASLLYFTGKQMGVKSIVIRFTTNRCYPAHAGLQGGGTPGPKGGCRK